MKIKSKYDKLAPRLDYLSDEIVLAQAWKKTHSYITKLNWYVDSLELDCTAINLDKNLKNWSASLRNNSYKSAPLMLVPAPKSAPWGFSPNLRHGWAPGLNHGKKLVLRPLAHLGIREQTISTALMLCVADCIESAQGNPELDPVHAASKKMYSYGNRLFCTWDLSNERAEFSWGSSNIYSQYFKDYQKFVSRPAKIAEKLEFDASRIFIVKLDLSAFYDNIDLPRLKSVIKDEYSRFAKKYNLRTATKQFWVAFDSAMYFDWRDEDQGFGHLFRDEVLPKGLPQGMVAGGFFANAYLLDFDKEMGAKIGEKLEGDPDLNIKIHDYCRYVDDLRLVISVDNSFLAGEETRLTDALNIVVQEILYKTTVPSSKDGRCLQLNKDKTEIEAFSSGGGSSGVAARMKNLQQQISGPVSIEILRGVEGGLHGLLALAELNLRDDNIVQSGSGSSDLAEIAKPMLEVRDDTLTRFAAYRLARSLRLRRAMTDLEEDINGSTASQALAHEYETTAKRLVAAWAKNPSLVQVLRYALDLFPSPDLLNTVTQALCQKIEIGVSNDVNAQAEQAVSFYVLAEIFRAGATETGRRAFRDLSFIVGDIVGYRENLAILGITLLEIPQLPWYVRQQISLMLASLGEPIATLGGGVEMRRHRALHNFLAGVVEENNTDRNDEVSISLVGAKLVGDPNHYRLWLKKFSQDSSAAEISSFLQLIAQTDLELLRETIKDSKLIRNLPVYLAKYVEALTKYRAKALVNSVWTPLLQVVINESKIFSQENAILQLASALIRLIENSKISADRLNVLTIEVRCDNWINISDIASSSLDARVVRKELERYDPVFEIPEWVDSRDYHLYAIGRTLRAAAAGELDYTAHHWVDREASPWYSSVRSTWYKRRIGMLHTATAIGGTSAAITPWLSDLLFQLLRWPGIGNNISFSENIGVVSSIKKLNDLIKKRLIFQKNIFGRSSGLPVYRFPINWKLRDNRALRVMIVQGLVPSSKDFIEFGLGGLSEAKFRKRHRNQTSALLNLINRKLAVRNSALSTQNKPTVDLVIFPEYSIHQEDHDLMRSFSDSTGAMLFYGVLGAVDLLSKKSINIARWLVPQRKRERRSWIEIDQGKFHVTKDEVDMGVQPWRPYQVVVELEFEGENHAYRISGAICYDATDISLAADLKNETHMFIAAAMNKDVKTFDSMVSTLRYHMYQHVLVANSGEFGGSTAQAPYDQEHKRLISHAHGLEQLAISIFDVKIDDFGPALDAAKVGKATTKTFIEKIGKTPPAGLTRKH